MTTIEPWKAAVFAVVSILLVIISRRSLLMAKSHGFYRFFAWELIALLFLLNVTTWFKDWLAWHQIISWVLLLACIVPLWLGTRALRERGKQERGGRQEPELFGFERTTQLVTEGIYRYIRHPLYSSLFILDWGIFFKRPSWLGLALAVLTSGLLLATARRDEAECLRTFGADYRLYMRRTRMFIPYVF